MTDFDDVDIQPRPQPILELDPFTKATGIGASPFAPLEWPRFTGGMSVDGVPAATRSQLNDLRRVIEGALAQSVAARLSGETVSDIVQVVNSVVDKPLESRLFLKIVKKDVTASFVNDMINGGVDFLPSSSDLVFPDGNPIKGRILYSGLVLDPSRAWWDRAYNSETVGKDGGGEGRDYTLTESTLLFSRAPDLVPGYPSVFKLSACILKTWETYTELGDDGLIGWLYPGFTVDNWHYLNEAGTAFRYETTVAPTKTESVGLGHADRAVWPTTMTAYFLAIQ